MLYLMEQKPFIIGTKSLPTATSLASGQLLVRGYLTRWNELDRVGDRMLKGSFREAIREFMRSPNRPFLFHHDYKAVLGQVTNLFEDQEGVVLEAKVGPQPQSSPWRHVYQGLKSGAIKALSAGGRFFRQPRADGTFDIYRVQLLECSATAVPALASTSLEVVSEGKALGLGWPGGGAPVDREAMLHRAEIDLYHLKAKLLREQVRQLQRTGGV